jgi:hypothetical protein
MATPGRINPAATTLNIEQVGRDISFFTVDYINAVNGSNGPNGVQQAVLSTIQTMHTIIAIGPLTDTNTQQTFAIEGDLYTPHNGTTLQAQIQALGATGGATGYLQTPVDTTSANVDVSSATVTATQLAILTAAVVAP